MLSEIFRKFLVAVVLILPATVSFGDVSLSTKEESSLRVLFREMDEELLGLDFSSTAAQSDHMIQRCRALARAFSKNGPLTVHGHVKSLMVTDKNQAIVKVERIFEWYEYTGGEKAQKGISSIWSPYGLRFEIEPREAIQINKGDPITITGHVQFAPSISMVPLNQLNRPVLVTFKPTKSVGAIGSFIFTDFDVSFGKKDFPGVVEIRQKSVAQPAVAKSLVQPEKRVRNNADIRGKNPRPQPNGTAGDIASGGALLILMLPIFMMLIFLAVEGFWLVSLIHCILNPNLKGNDRLVWILLTIFLNWIGALLYWFIGKPKSGPSKKNKAPTPQWSPISSVPPPVSKAMDHDRFKPPNR